MNSGWVKLHRKLWDNPRSKDQDWVSLWFYLVSHAAYAPTKTVFQGVVIELKPGQLVAGRKVLSEKTGVQESKVQRVLALMESEQQIEQQNESKSRLITIKNWEMYQGEGDAEQQNEQQMNNKRTTNEQQLNTLKRIKEDKEEEREAPARRPRSRQPVVYEPSQEALTLFLAWKAHFPKDDAPKVQTCKNIEGRLKSHPFQALLFSVLKYRAAVSKATAERPEGVLAYKGSNFFGERAYYADHLPLPGQLDTPQIQNRLQAVLEALKAKEENQ